MAATGTPQASALWARVTATRPPRFAKPVPGMGFFEKSGIDEGGMAGAMSIRGEL